MNATKTKIDLEFTRTGKPALWESGGGMSNTGSAQIVCAADGKPKKPVYIRRRGQLSCAEHALFVVEKGDIVIKADHHRQDFSIQILEITDFVSRDEWIKKSTRYERISESAEAFCSRISDYYNSAGLRLLGIDNVVSRNYIDNDPSSALYFTSTVRYEEHQVENAAECRTLADFDRGEWRFFDNIEGEFIADAVEAAKTKAVDYHCRSAYYVA